MNGNISIAIDQIIIYRIYLSDPDTAAGGASVGPSTLVVVQLFNATETTTLVQLLMRAVNDSSCCL